MAGVFIAAFPDTIVEHAINRRCQDGGSSQP
jgi:hypothetical protein